MAVRILEESTGKEAGRKAEARLPVCTLLLGPPCPAALERGGLQSPVPGGLVFAVPFIKLELAHVRLAVSGP